MKEDIVKAAMIFTVIPYHIILDDKYGLVFFNITYFIPLIIGFILFFINYKKYEKRQKVLLIIAIILFVINTLSTIHQWVLDLNVDDWKTDTMSDLGPYLLDSLVFWGTYFGFRIICLFTGFNILNKK